MTQFLDLEPERYELRESPAYRFTVDRRRFFQTLGCGVVVLLIVEPLVAQEAPRGRRQGGRGGGLPADIGAWLHIGEDNTVTVFTGKVEVGQNIRTALTQAVAEELRAPIANIHLVMADTDLTPNEGGTSGSRTIPASFPQLRRVAAAAREALLDLAAEALKVERSTLKIADGKVYKNEPSDGLMFGQLTKGQRVLKQTSGQTASLHSAKEWTAAGTSVPKVNGRDLVTGRHKFTSDVSLPGMLHAKVIRPSAFNSTLESVDLKAAEDMPDVKVVHDGNFVGVAAKDILTATRAADAIKAQWKSAPQPSSADLYDYLHKTPTENGAAPATIGSVQGDAPSDEHKFHQVYRIAYIAHTPLEPRAAVAEWKDGKLTVWTGTQQPFGVRSSLAQTFGLADNKVRVIVPDTGSGYGGKHTGEAAIEAARLAKAAGKPVKLVWTRKEELTWAYFRPAGVIEVSSSVKKDGTITSWDFHNYNSGGSAVRTPYDIPSARSEFHSTKYPLRQGSYRGLASTANVFARESHMDDMARAIQMDPLEFRLKNLKDGRLRAVLEAAAKAFGWGKEKPSPGHGFGIGAGTEKGSYLATCAEVVVDKGAVQVVRAVSAFECGAVVNPGHLKNQVEGALIMGLGGALFEAIEFENGKVTNARLADYRVPRFSDAPRIEVVLVNRKDLVSAGAGETPIIGIAPAVRNAICDATGIRLYALPLVPNGLKA